MQVHRGLQLDMWHISDCCIWLPKQFEALWLQAELAKVLVAFRLRRFAEFSWSSELSEDMSNLCTYKHVKHTAKISWAFFTHSQSVSDNVNADHGICFETWLLRRIVVIGPYQWSAVATNKLMGCFDHIMCNRNNFKLITYLANGVRYMEHAMGSPPPNIAVKRNFEWICNEAFYLKLFKCLDPLPRQLDLFSVNKLKQCYTIKYNFNKPLSQECR